MDIGNKDISKFRTTISIQGRNRFHTFDL